MCETLARSVTVGPHRNRVTFPAGTKLQLIAPREFVVIDMPGDPEVAMNHVGDVVKINYDAMVPPPPSVYEKRRVLAELVAGWEYV